MSVTIAPRPPLTAANEVMHTPVFHFHNDYGIPFPSIGAGVREEGIFFRRFVGLIYPGRNDSIIGRGGSGVIHVVRDKIMDRVVALKLPNESILAEPQVRSEVLNEASQALELTHPNIVRIYDFHDQDGRWGISMQYIRGRNLDEWREKLAPHQMAGGSFYDVDQIKSWILQLCEALSYAHEEAGIAHCDIKPRNLLLERSFDTRTRQVREKLLLTDFGITQKLRDFTTRTQRHKSALKSPSGSGSEDGGAAGTLAYMSPQQLGGGESSIADDIYAAGITIYELLTGRPPFYQGDAKVIQHQIESVTPPGMMARRRERGVKAATPIPDLWEQVTAQCLHKDASKRPANARELARLLGLSSATVSTVSEIEEERRRRETETLRVTVHTQEKQISELTGKVQELEGIQAHKVDETVFEETRAEVVRLETALREKDAHLTELDEQLQDLEEERKTLQQKLEEERQALQKQLDQKANASDEVAARLAQEREGVSSRLQQVQAEAAKIREERDIAKSILKKTEQTVDELRAKLEASIKEANEAKNKARTADSSIQKVKDEEAAARKSIEAARVQAEQKLAQARQEAEIARQEAASAKAEKAALAHQQTAPLRPVLMVLLGVITFGVIAGASIGWLSAPSSGDVSKLKELAISSGTRPFVVKNQHVRTYLNQLGLAEDALGASIKTGAAEEPAKGLSWLEAAAFCEWLTQLTGADSRTKWYDLPDMNEAKSNGKPAGLQAWTEWTRDEDSTGVSSVQRKMKVCDHASPNPRAEVRTKKDDDIGFRCVLRELKQSAP